MFFFFTVFKTVEIFFFAFQRLAETDFCVWFKKVQIVCDRAENDYYLRQSEDETNSFFFRILCFVSCSLAHSLFGVSFFFSSHRSNMKNS